MYDNAAPMCEGKSLTIKPPSLEEELLRKQQRLEEQLTDIKRMQELLKDNPTLAELNNLLIRCRNI